MRTLIIGCGYLGWRVAERWLSKGCSVTAITRKDSTASRMQRSGIQPVLADVTSPKSLTTIGKPFDVVLFSVGFDRSTSADIRHIYVAGLRNVVDHLYKDTQRLIYISTTGVYGNSDGQWVDESTPPSPVRPSAKACLEAEQIIASSPFADRSTILRLAGIYGPDRIPRLSTIRNQEWSSLSPHGHINLIHVNDATNIIDEVGKRELESKTLLVSDGKPPERKLFFEYIADRIGVGPIDWNVATKLEVAERAAANKRISNRNLVRLLSYQYEFPDYRVGIDRAIDLSRN